METKSKKGKSKSLKNKQPKMKTDSRGRTICTWKDAYEADKFEINNKDEKTEQYSALTRKNARFIEAVVKLDSNYGWDMGINEPEEGYNPFKHEDFAKDKKGKKRYYGSIAYWFDRMGHSDNPKDFKECVMGAITTIDITNSTRMSVDERKELAARIIDESRVPDNSEVRSCFCKDVEALRKRLEDPFDPNSDSPNNGIHHIFAVLADKAKVGNSENGPQEESKVRYRYNVSFASKFCSYAAQHLLEPYKDIYSKYDNVVSDKLAVYLGFYCPDVDLSPVSPFKIDNVKANSMKGDKGYRYRLEVYERYCCLIGKIISSLDKGNKISRDEFDHIIWYSEK